MPDHTIVKLEFPGSPRLISIARKTVEGIAQRTALTCSQIEDLKIAVGEACCHAVRFSNPKHSPVTVRCLVKKEHLQVEVCSRVADCSDQDQKTEPEEDEDNSNARLGFYLIDHLVDEWSVESESGDKHIKLVMRYPTE
jgi:serine/threonine-protein kinase RsbW